MKIRIVPAAAGPAAAAGLPITGACLANAEASPTAATATSTPASRRAPKASTEAHMVRADGTHVIVQVDRRYAVTTVQGPARRKEKVICLVLV